MTSNVSALFINDLVAAIALSVFHKTEVSLVLDLYNMHIINHIHNNKQYSGSEISRAFIEAIDVPSMLTMNFISLTRYKFCKWWQEKLS